jgi:hypothetical protein
MAKSSNSRTGTNPLWILAAVVLVFACVIGPIGGLVMQSAHKQSCQFIEEGISQFNPQMPGGYQPKTAEECVKVYEIQTPFYLLWGAMGGFILSIGGIMTLIAASLIFRRRK